jgi:hypothetical protein
MRPGHARRLMVGLTLGTLGWIGAAGGASAQEEGPPPSKVRVRLTSPDELALKLFIISAPAGKAPRKACKLPCELDLVPGTYRVRFRESGLKRSWPRSFTVTGSGAFRVTYRYRSLWRALGGILFVSSLGWAGYMLSYVAIAARLWGIGGVLMVTAAALGPAVVIALPLMLLPDKARMVPVR